MSVYTQLLRRVQEEIEHADGGDVFLVIPHDDAVLLEDLIRTKAEQVSEESSLTL